MQFEGILTKGSLSIIWLSATLGPRHKKGPSKKQMQQCDLVDACQKITDPARPIPLRTSAGLLVGVVRVHGACYDYFVNDVINLEYNVRRAMVDVRTTGTGGLVAGLDLANGGQARLDIITGPTAKVAEVIPGGGDYIRAQAADWDAFMENQAIVARREAGDFSQDESGVDSGRSRESTPIDRAARHMADPKDITLPAHRHRLASIDSNIQPRRSSLQGSQDDFSDDHFLPEALDGEVAGPEGADVNDFMFGETAGGRRRRQGSAEGSVGVGGAADASSSGNEGAFAEDDGTADVGAEGIDLGLDGLDDVDLDRHRRPVLGGRAASLAGSEQARQDLEQGRQEQQRRLEAVDIGTPLRADIRPHNDDAENELAGFGGDDNQQMDIDQEQLPEAQEELPAEEIEVEVDVQPTAPKAKKKKGPKNVNVIDNVLELTDIEARAMRTGYIADMQAQRQDADSREQERVTISSALAAEVDGPVIDLGFDQGMNDFFKDLVEKGRVKRPANEPRSRKRKAGEGEQQDHEPIDLEVADVEFPRQDDADMGGFGGLGDDMAVEEPERHRGGTQEADIEIGRRVTNNSRHSSVPPWDRPRVVSEAGDELMPGGGSSITGTNARFSLDTPMEGRLPQRFRSNSALSGASRIPGSVNAGDLPGSVGGEGNNDLGDMPGYGEDNIDLPDHPLDPERPPQAVGQQSQASLDVSTMNILDYIKQISQQKGADVFGEDQSITFEEIAPRNERSKTNTAKAFYSCLALATKDLLKLDQPVPFDEITISIKRK